MEEIHVDCIDSVVKNTVHEVERGRADSQIKGSWHSAVRLEYTLSRP